MRDFACPNCGQQLAFENSVCLKCQSNIGFDLTEKAFAVVGSDGTTTGQPGARAVVQQMCGNLGVAGCNWLTPAGIVGALCVSCALTRTRPADTDTVALPEFAAAEAAKRRLIVELSELGLPIDGRDTRPEGGLAFDLLSSEQESVITGHDEGLITLDLAESDDVHRERLRISMDEPYRTLLGHFRHEIGHYYFTVLVGTGPRLADFQDLFGDPDIDYQEQIERHYAQGAPAGWQQHYVSSYATMHPAEDWAETFAHYLHIRDTVDTAAAFAFAPAGATLDHRLPGAAGFNRLIALWIPLAWSLNMINRSMGHADLYPFVLPPKVLDKMRLVHSLVQG